MRTLCAWILAVSLVGTVGLVAQQRDAELDQLLQQYQTAWAKGDAKALAALYTENAIRMTDQGMVQGRQAIQQMFEKNFAADWKGTKVTITPGRTVSINPDVRIQEGTFELTGAGPGPQRGRFVNTVVRQGGEWRIASLAAFPATEMPKK